MSNNDQTQQTQQTQLERIEAVSRKLAAIENLAAELRQTYDVYDGQADRYIRETRRGFVEKMLREWAGQHAPHLPDGEIRNAIDEARRATQHGGMRQMFEHALAAWQKDGQAQHMSEIERDRKLSSLVPANFYDNGNAAAKLRPSGCVLRVSIRLYSYHGSFSLYEARDGLRLLAEVLDAELQPSMLVDLRDPIERARGEGRLGQKYATGQSPVRHLKVYKNGKLDIWLDSQEAADKVAAVLLGARARVLERYNSR